MQGRPGVPGEWACPPPVLGPPSEHSHHALGEGATTKTRAGPGWRAPSCLAARLFRGPFGKESRSSTAALGFEANCMVFMFSTRVLVTQLLPLLSRAAPVPGGDRDGKLCLDPR